MHTVDSDAARAMDQMQVTVPAGVGPGMAFRSTRPEGMQVVCPEGVSAGGQMLVNARGPGANVAVRSQCPWSWLRRSQW